MPESKRVIGYFVIIWWGCKARRLFPKFTEMLCYFAKTTTLIIGTIYRKPFLSTASTDVASFGYAGFT